MGIRRGRPLVIVTGPEKRLRFGWWATRLMLWMQGLKGRYITAHHRTVPPDVCGVIIGGGDDIHPEHYGVTGDAGAHYDPARDQLELNIIARAIAEGLPLFGICRGAQLLNVALQGDLHQDLRPVRQYTPNRNSVFPIKEVRLKPQSKVREIIGTERIRVNSLHNQAVRRIGHKLKATATDRDQFIQAIEDPEKPFFVGVQWHPEYMPYSGRQRRLFQGFAQAVRAFYDKKRSDIA